MIKKSIGIIEVVGIVTAAACIDAMTKTAYVEVSNLERIGSGLITIIIEGDLASVQVAIEAGEEMATRFGEMIATRVIARPYEGLDSLLTPIRTQSNIVDEES